MGIQRVAFTLFEPFENGRRRTLRFDLNALADFEQEVGMGFPQLLMSKSVFAAARGLAWAGLKHEDRGLTIEKVGQLMQKLFETGKDVSEVLRTCIEAAQEQGALRKAKPEEEDEYSTIDVQGNAPKPLPESES